MWEYFYLESMMIYDSQNDTAVADGRQLYESIKSVNGFLWMAQLISVGGRSIELYSHFYCEWSVEI